MNEDVFEELKVMANEEDVASILPVPTPKEDKRKPRKSTRSMEELDAVEPHRMTPEEMKPYIKHLRAAVNSLETELTSRVQNVQSTFAQNRVATAELESLRRDYTLKMNYITQAVNSLNDSIKLIVKGGIN